MTAELAVPPIALAAYLQNVVDGRPMRDIARDFNCEPSTILRRIRKCEELRDHPEWDALLLALEEHRGTALEPCRGLPGRHTVLEALNLTAAQTHAEFCGQMHILRRPSALVLIGDAPRAAISEKGAPTGGLSRCVALAALAFGWLVPHGPAEKRVRTLRITEAAIEAAFEPKMLPAPADEDKRPPSRKFGPQPNPVEVALRRSQHLLTANHLRTAQRFQVLYMGRQTVAVDAYAALSRTLPPRLLLALEEVCGKGTGFETLERKMSLPARSAKAIVALGLEAVEHAGFAA